MNQQDELAQDIRAVDGNHSLGAAELAERLIERGYSRPRVVETIAELEALPEGSVIYSANAFPLEKVPNEFGTPWAYGPKLVSNRSVQLPATVLYLPEETP
ncbi:hypothetical protein DEU38_103168 [Rhodococcus sp. AG1013]|uniref:hypothetical protein n=1 Tax=Rhodococcus sp. AG1013 TaxID=2183996 RepID=UPI000E2B58E5|nr:hypothetical protein [Rhodococcus sp. AG1013]RDI32435.1 hypothetical protein DEU38_103168 [Rhodococcus sp. AG1013]